MTLRKLLLGSAAVIGTAGGAQAADFNVFVPVAEPANYVAYCNDDEGIIVGNDTCLTIGGRVRFTIDFAEGAAEADDNNLEGNWAFTTDARVDFRALRETEYGELEAFFRLGGTAEGHPEDSGEEREIQLQEAWLRLGWFQAGYLGSIHSALSSGGYIGSPSSNQIRLVWENGAWEFAVAFEDPRRRAREANPATMQFPDLLARLDGSLGPIDTRISVGYGARDILNVWGIIKSVRFDVFTGGQLRLNAAYGQNGFDFVSNTFRGSDSSGIAGHYWAASIGYNQEWNDYWSSTIVGTWADGPDPFDGRRRVTFSTQFEPFATNEFQITKEIEFEQRQDLNSFSGQPWVIEGLLRFTRNFP